jgi:hypothetical protein
MAGLSDVAADADAADEAVAAGEGDEDPGLVIAADVLAAADDEQPPIAIAATRQAQRSHR